MHKSILILSLLLVTVATTVPAKSQQERLIWILVTDSYGKPLAHVSVNTVEWGKPVMTTNSGRAGVPVSPETKVGDSIQLIITSRHYTTVTGGTIGIRISSFNRPDQPIPITLKSISTSQRKSSPTVAVPAPPNGYKDPFERGKRARRAHRFLEAFEQLSKAYETRREFYQTRPNKRTKKEYAEVNLELGMVLVILNKISEGVEKLKEAIRLDPADDESKFMLGVIGLNTGNVKEAEQMFNRLLLLKSPQSDEIKWTSYLFLARLYAVYGKFDEARRLQEMVSRKLSVHQFASNRDINQLMQVIGRAEADALAENTLPTYAYPSINLGAIILHKARLGLVTRLQGPLGPDVLMVLEHLSGVIPPAKQAEKKKSLDLQLAVQKRVLGHDHAFLGITLIQSAVFSTFIDKLDDAESSLSEAQTILQKSLGKDNYWTALTHAGLGYVHSRQGRLESAKQHWSDAQKILCEPGDQMNLTVCAGVLKDISSYYREQNNYAEAVPPLRRALNIEKSLWAGKDSQGTATLFDDISSLMSLYTLLGKSAEIEALQLEKQSIENMGVQPKADLWRYEPTVAIKLNGDRCYYLPYFDFIKYPKAKSILEAAVRATKYIEASDTDVVETKYRLAAIYLSEKRYKEAQLLLDQALEGNEKSLHPDREVADALLSLQAAIHERLDDSVAAETRYRQAVNMSSVLLEDKRKDSALHLFALARVQRAKHNYSEAENNLRRALEIRESAGEELCRELDSVTILFELANVYVDSGKYPDADKAFKQVLQAIGDCCLAEYEHSARILADYARCLRKMGREVEAVDMEKRVLSLKNPG